MSQQLTKAEMDAERISYANEHFDILSDKYPKQSSLQDDLDLLSDGTDDTLKEEARLRMDKAFLKVERQINKKKIEIPQERTGAQNIGPELRKIRHHSQQSAIGAKNLVTTGKIQEGLKSTAHAFAAVSYGLAATSRSLGMHPISGFLFATSLTTGVFLYQDYQERQAQTLIDDFKVAAANKDVNMQLFAQTAIEGAKSGASPIVLTMIMAAETGFFDVDGMRNKNGTDFYQGPFQDGPASLVEMIRHHALDSEFYKTAIDDDPYKIAIDAFFEDGRYKTQSGREDLVKDLTDGRNDIVWRTLLDLRNKPVFGQLVGASIVEEDPRANLSNMSTNIDEHYEQAKIIASEHYLKHLAGILGEKRLQKIANIAPDTKFSDTETIAKIISDSDKPSDLAIRSAENMLKMAIANKNTVFKDGADTKFGDVKRYTQEFIIERGEKHYKPLLIEMGADASIFVAQNGTTLTTSPRPKPNPKRNEIGG